jgi:pimeloyl-ACP methyl ester carboxylesterase
MSIRKKIGLSFISVIAFINFVFCFSFSLIDSERQKLTDQYRENSTGDFIALTDGVTHYESNNNESQKNIILIHDYHIPYYVWDSTYDFLTKQGFHVIRYDLYGRGLSDRPNVTYDETLFRNQLLELYTKLQIKSPITLAGISFGAAIATGFSLHYPELVDKIILIDPVYQFKKLQRAKQYENVKMILNSLQTSQELAKDFKHPENFPDWSIKYKEQTQFVGFRNAILSTASDYNVTAIKDNYRKLNNQEKKILLIWGEEDHSVPFTYSDSIRSIMKAEFFPVRNAAHFPQLEQPSLVNAKIAAFIQE